MKYTLLILLSSLLFVGCSKKQAAPTGQAMDIIKTGTDTKWGDSVLHVTKRDGASLEGVTITTKSSTGKIQTISADTGTFSSAPVAKDVVMFALHDAKLKTDTATADLGEQQVELHR